MILEKFSDLALRHTTESPSNSRCIGGKQSKESEGQVFLWECHGSEDVFLIVSLASVWKHEADDDDRWREAT